MRLLVGTLYTIENEFEECCLSIQGQTYQDFEHLIIQNLPKQQAHEKLYGTFMDRTSEFDLLVKVDADMILEDRDLFEKIVERFEADPELDLLLISVHDFFTDGLLIGLNVFRNTVRWNLGKEALFTDMTYVDRTIRKTRKDKSDLAPAAVHCRDPSPFQAYHYGFHRGMKAVRGGKRWDHLERLFDHYRRNPDLRLAYGLLGANAAFNPAFSIQHISYNNDSLLRYFQRRYDGKPEAQIHTAVRRSKVFWLHRLPIARRVVRRLCRFRADWAKSDLGSGSA